MQPIICNWFWSFEWSLDHEVAGDRGVRGRNFTLTFLKAGMYTAVINEKRIFLFLRTHSDTNHSLKISFIIQALLFTLYAKGNEWKTLRLFRTSENQREKLFRAIFIGSNYSYPYFALLCLTPLQSTSLNVAVLCAVNIEKKAPLHQH